MKIGQIKVKNFLGARSVDITLNNPVTMIVGANGAGKSSLQEAVRMALTGETVRVGLKKEFERLITEGETIAEIAVSSQDHGTYGVILPSGKGGAMLNPGAMPYVLDAQRFAGMSENERRAFLFGLMKLSSDSNDTVKRLLGRGCDQEKIEFIRPLLRIGFDAAREEAANKARESKGAWRAITGEIYGGKKAEGWSAISTVAAVDDAQIADLEADLVATQAELEAKITALAEMKARASVAQGIAELAEKAGRIKQIKDALSVDEAGVIEWTHKVEAARAAANSEERSGLVHDLARSLSDSLSIIIMPLGKMDEAQRGILSAAKASLDDYKSQYGEIQCATAVSTNAEAKQRLPEYERSLGIYQNAVDNGKRNLAVAEAAAAALESMAAGQAQDAPTGDEILLANNAIADLREHKKAIETALNNKRDDKRRAIDAADKTAKAASHHLAVKQWELIAEHLAPDGIPGDILNAAIEPLNERLSMSASLAEWPAVSICGDMGISYGGRSYRLISESERWRADAMLAEAISHMSGGKLLVLDRFDVLDMGGREDLLLWLSDLAEKGEIETVLIFGTLKGLPSNLPENISAFWIDGGICQNEGGAAWHP